MIFKKELIVSISKELGLDFTGFEQDWDIELADINRIDEFIKYYEKTILTKDKKIALMALILASYDDYLSSEEKIEDKFRDNIRKFLKQDSKLFFDLFLYWGLPNEISVENLFKITPFIREIDKECSLR